MNARRIIPMFTLAFALTITRYAACGAGPLVAYSLSEAERCMKHPPCEPAVESLGGIARVLGVVIDIPHRDVVIIGQVGPGDRSASLDDLAVALRALLVHRQWPLVSIDPPPDPQAKWQVVRFEGGIANTQFGKDLLDADVVLKCLTLGSEVEAQGGAETLSSAWQMHRQSRTEADFGLDRMPPLPRDATPEELQRWRDEWQRHGEAQRQRLLDAERRADATRAKWGFPSYCARTLERASQSWSLQDTSARRWLHPVCATSRSASSQDANARFWFHPEETRVTVRPGIGVIHDLRIAVHAEVTATGLAPAASGPPALRNEAAEQFAAAVTTHYDRLAIAYPAVGRIKPLLDLVAVAHVLESLQQKATLQYWLTAYPVAEVKTLKDIGWSSSRSVSEATKDAEAEQPFGYVREVSGGIRLQTMLQQFDEEGDITVIRDLVLMSRPPGHPLVWKLPLESWQIAACSSQTQAASPAAPTFPIPDGQPIGCNVRERRYLRSRSNP